MGDVVVVEGSSPAAGLVAGAVVGEDSFNGDAVRGERAVSAVPELCRGGALFVGEDLGVHEPGAVIDCGVQEPVGNAGTSLWWCLASAVDTPATAIFDARQLLDLDVDELAGPVSLVATGRFSVGGSVADIEPAQTFGSQNVLDGRCGQAGLVSDAVSTPAPLLAKTNDLATSLRGRLVG